MRSLNTLIRLHKWKLNEERRKLAEMFELAEDMQSRLKRLDHDLKAEGEGVDGSVSAARSYSAYLKSGLERRACIEASHAELEREIVVIEDRVAEAFRELKTYEISLQRRGRDAKRLRARKEQATLDEVGQQVHRRHEGRGGG